MLTTGLHWLSALAIALGVHTLGLLWFDPVRPTLPKPNVFSDEIVVMLGQESGGSTESARLLTAPDSVTKLEISKHAEAEPLTSPAEKNVKSNKVEEAVAPSLARRAVELATVQPSKSPDAVVVEHKPEARGVGVSEIGEAVPSLTISGAETAESVATVTVATETLEADVPAPAMIVEQRAVVAQTGVVTQTVEADAPAPAMIVEQTGVVAQTGDADQSAPALVDIESPDAEATIVVSPTQLVRETADVDASDTVIAPAQSTRPAPAAATVDTAATAPQPDDLESEQPVAVEVEQDIQHSRLAAVVLEFETVEATTIVSSRAPAPQVAQPVSIEQQIARALSVDELQGQEGAGKGIVARYAGQLKGRLEESMHYPRAARLAGQEGKVVVRFVIDRNGRVLSIVLEQASGHAILDREAVEMIERGEPFPVMPTEMGDDVLELRVPIAYQIKEEEYHSCNFSKDIPPIYLE